MAKFKPAEKSRVAKTEDEAGPIRITISRSDSKGKANITRTIAVASAKVSELHKLIRTTLFE